MENLVPLPEHVLEYYAPLQQYVFDNKGKSYVERYGSERALEILKKKSLSSKGKKHNYTPKVKGRTYEEIYGKEKALAIKKKLSEANKNQVPHIKGKTFEEAYGVERSKTIKAIRNKKLSELQSRLKGKTYKEIFGDEAQEIIKKHSESMKGRPSHLKNKTWEEVYGKEQSNLMKRNIQLKSRESRKNQVFPVRDSVPEKLVQSYLTEHNIQFQKHVPFKVGDTYHQVDILLPNNIVIEVDGCFWHQCEQCEKNKGYHGYHGKTAQEVRDKYNRIYSKIESLGYRVIRIWGHDIKVNNFSPLNEIFIGDLVSCENKK
jgi:G:T-mismatch repair DNA endonuclease (very short patch repair protein)